MSHSGTDNNMCGLKINPCGTPFYALTRRAQSNDTIALEESTRVYVFNVNVRVRDKSLNFLGLGKGVTIVSERLFGFITFRTKNARITTASRVTIQNIHFRGFL